MSVAVVIEFEKTELSVNESDKTISLCLVKTGESLFTDEAILVVCDHLTDKETATGMGRVGMDYNFSSLQVTVPFKPSEYRKCEPVTIVDDRLVEEMEVFGVCITSATKKVIIGPKNRAVVTIIDDDCECALSLSLSLSVCVCVCVCVCVHVCVCVCVCACVCVCVCVVCSYLLNFVYTLLLFLFHLHHIALHNTILTTLQHHTNHHHTPSHHTLPPHSHSPHFHSSY